VAKEMDTDSWWQDRLAECVVLEVQRLFEFSLALMLSLGDKKQKSE
jgi:hypothetical protein